MKTAQLSLKAQRLPSPGILLSFEGRLSLNSIGLNPPIELKPRAKMNSFGLAAQLSALFVALQDQDDDVDDV